MVFNKNVNNKVYNIMCTIYRINSVDNVHYNPQSNFYVIFLQISIIFMLFTSFIHRNCLYKLSTCTVHLFTKILSWVGTETKVLALVVQSFFTRKIIA